VNVGYQEQFWLSFVGIVGNNFQGDIALDDLKFLNCRVGRYSKGLANSFSFFDADCTSLV